MGAQALSSGAAVCWCISVGAFVLVYQCKLLSGHICSVSAAAVDGCAFLSAATLVTSSKTAAALWVENVLCLAEVSHVARCCRMQTPCSMLEGEHWVRTPLDDETRPCSDRLYLQPDAGACGFGETMCSVCFYNCASLSSCKEKLWKSIKKMEKCCKRQSCCKPGMGCWSW